MLPMKIQERIVVDPNAVDAKREYYYSGTYRGISGQTPPCNSGGSYEILHTVDRQSEPPERRTRKYMRDNGGPFRVDRAQVTRTMSSYDAWSKPYPGRYDYHVHGKSVLQPYYTDATMPPETLTTGQGLKDMVNISSPFYDNLSTFGPTAIARMSPLNPGANVGQALSELMFDGLPTLPLKLFARHKLLKAAGSDYLNVQFGWLPFLSDLRDLYNTWNTLNKRLQQIVRDNGRPVRRRITLRNDVSTTVTDLGGYGWAGPQLGGYSSQWSDPPLTSPLWKRSRTVKSLDKIWASGRFRYYIPDPSDDRWSDGAKLALFGLTPTPALLWEVMPWSWLIDWFSNVGDVIKNWSSNGIADLTIDYCYLMRHQRLVKTWEASEPPIGFGDIYPYSFGYTTSNLHLSTQYLWERKERIAASPFGFDVQLSSLTARQLAILAALGLSRQNFV